MRSVTNVYRFFYVNFKFALSVAAVCCPIEPGEDVPSILRYLKAVLDRFFDKTTICAEVQAIPYPPCSKLPVMITLNGKDPRLLWYYKGMRATDLSDELYWLLSDTYLATGHISA